jgi:uncharacterized protein involved in exopolysaccharide biosynthesis
MHDRNAHSEETTLADICRLFKRRKYTFLLVVGVSVMATAVVSFLLPEIYEAKAVILPVSRQDSTTAAKSAVAAQFGLSAPDTSDSSEVVSLLESNVIKTRIFKKCGLLPFLVQEEDLKGKSENERLWEGIRRLRKTLRVDFNRKDNIIELSMQHREPAVAVRVLSCMLEELTGQMTGEARRVADTNRRYLESLIDETSDPFIRAKIYSLIAEQIQTAMLTEVKENFAFKVIDPPLEPDRKVKPNILLNIATSFIFASFVGAGVIFLREYLDAHAGKDE